MAIQELGFSHTADLPGSILRVSRNELSRSLDQDFTKPKEVAILKFFQRLAVLPKIEGLALSRIKGWGSLYYTVIHRHMLERNSEETSRSLKDFYAAHHDLTDALGEVIPGSFINLPEGIPFYKATRQLRGKRFSSEFDLIGIVHFV